MHDRIIIGVTFILMLFCNVFCAKPFRQRHKEVEPLPKGCDVINRRTLFSTINENKFSNDLIAFS